MREVRNKNILLLGGEGFLGRNISDLLSNSFNCQSIGRSETIFSKLRKDVFFKLNPYLREFKNDSLVIINLLDNIISRKNIILEEFKLMNNVKPRPGSLLIFFSSAATYFEPKSEYGVRKKILEDFYFNFCKKNRIRLVIFRLYNVYGPYQIPGHPGSLVSNLLVNHFKHKKTIINNLEIKRDFVYTKDVAKVVDAVIHSNFEGLTDLATGKYTTIGSLIREIELLVGNTLEISVKSKEESLFCPLPNVKFGREQLVTNLQNGLRETISFYKDVNKYGEI